MDTEKSTELIVFPRAETPYRDFALEVVSLIDTANQLVVNNKADSKVATDHLGAVKDRRVAIEAFKKELLSPLRQRTTDINDAMKELLEPLEGAKNFVDRLILAFNEAEREKVRQAEEIERRKQELAALEGKPAPAPTPVPAQPQAVTKGEHTQSGERWLTKYELIDFSLVPDEYKKLDDTKVGQAVRASKGTLAIPGIRIFKEPVIAIGRS